MRLAVHDTECADRETLRRPQWHARIEANKRRIDHERIVGKTLVEKSVLNDEAISGQNGMSAKRDITRCFTRLDTHASFEPLTVRINQTNQRAGGVADVSRQTRKIVEGLF